MISPIEVLKEAIRAVPAVRYALGVGGMIATVALVQVFEVDPVLAAVGTLVLFFFMAVLVIFARMASLGKNKMALPALFFTWLVLVFFSIVSASLFSSVFFKWPLELRWLDPDVRSGDYLEGIKISYVSDGQSKENALGYMYENGIEVNQNYQKAAYWYEKGIERGDSDSMVDYAELLGNGKGVQKDLDRAVELFLAAGRQGNARGLFKTGLFYRDAGDYKRAVDYLEKSAIAGWVDAYDEIGNLFESGYFGDQRLGESLVWYRKGVQAGSNKAKHSLGLALFNGRAGEKDSLKAVALLEEISMVDEYNDLATVLWVLGEFYSEKETPAFDLVRARKVYEMAAVKGHPCSRTKLASILIDGPEKNIDLAVDILESGVADRQPQSILFLAMRLLDGNGIPQDLRRAERLLILGANIGDVDSMIILADLYRLGKFGVIDNVASAQYLATAAKIGSKNAQDKLKKMIDSGYQCVDGI
jgi:TPR repeat protein